ncbi:MAG: hypothetical protein ACR2M0_16520 [Chloroflexia bacterium]
MNKIRITIMGLAAVALLGFLAGAAMFAGAIHTGVNAAPEMGLAATAGAAPQATSTAGDAARYMALFNGKFAAKLGISEQQLNTAFAGAIAETADQAVKDGSLTSAQAADVKANLQSPGNLLALGSKALMSGGGSPDNFKNQDQYLNPKMALLQATERLLGLSADELSAQIKQGKSLGEIAQAHNVTADQLKTAILAAFREQLNSAVGTGKLTQAQSDQNYQDFSGKVDGIISGHGSADSSTDGPNVKGAAFTAVEHLLGISENDLFDQLKAGKSLAQIAQAHNVTVAQLKAAIQPAIRAELDSAVRVGKLTQVQADQIYRDTLSRLDSLINNTSEANGTPGAAPDPNSTPTK